MVYIIELYNPNIEIDITTASYIYTNNKIKAYTIASNYARCHGGDIGINVYEALNEYTNKRKLIKQY